MGYADAVDFLFSMAAVVAHDIAGATEESIVPYLSRVP
jgi:hypothetical protein